MSDFFDKCEIHALTYEKYDFAMFVLKEDPYKGVRVLIKDVDMEYYAIQTSEQKMEVSVPFTCIDPEYEELNTDVDFQLYFRNLLTVVVSDVFSSEEKSDEEEKAD
jgi:hypothetical protein